MLPVAFAVQEAEPHLECHTTTHHPFGTLRRYVGLTELNCGLMSVASEEEASGERESDVPIG